jgi:hypothetical protein
VNDEPKERVITFRVTEEQYSRINDCGFNAGRSANEWCRELAVAESSKDFGMTANERILLEEIAVLRKLLGVLAAEILSPEKLNELRENVNEHYEKYGRDVLEKRVKRRREGTSEWAIEEG